MIDVVRSDLEKLLNTRQSDADVPEAFEEVRRSLLLYGLPDFASLNASTAEQRRQIATLLETAIGQFEPRLRDVKATLIDPDDAKSRTVRFRIDARLRMEPAPSVAYETTLDLGSGRYAIKPGDGEEGA